MSIELDRELRISLDSLCAMIIESNPGVIPIGAEGARLAVVLSSLVRCQLCRRSPPNGSGPVTRELAKEWGLSLDIADVALRLLCEEGLLEWQPWRGYTVTHEGALTQRSAAPLSQPSNYHAASGSRAQEEIAKAQ